jgi:hypothetical protein
MPLQTCTAQHQRIKLFAALHTGLAPYSCTVLLLALLLLLLRSMDDSGGLTT